MWLNDQMVGSENFSIITGQKSILKILHNFWKIFDKFCQRICLILLRHCWRQIRSFLPAWPLLLNGILPCTYQINSLVFVLIAKFEQKISSLCNFRNFIVTKIFFILQSSLCLCFCNLLKLIQVQGGLHLFKQLAVGCWIT